MKTLVDTQNWCSCIDGSLTKENYIDSIRKAGFTNIEVLDEKPYMELEQDKDPEKRQITSLSIRAVQAIKIVTWIRKVIHMKLPFTRRPSQDTKKTSPVCLCPKCGKESDG